MSQIVTLTFNPCIDKNTRIEKLLPEKKLRCSRPEFEPGGGGINVSRVLKCLGHDALSVLPTGGHTGRFLQQLMAKEGLKFKAVETASYTRENLIVFEEASRQQFRFGMPGNPISADDCESLLRYVEETTADYIVASGSLMPGMPVNMVARIAQIARKKRARLVLDTSGEALQKALEVGVFLLKPNLGELSSLVGREEVNSEAAVEIAQEIIGKGQCEIIVVSMGPNGAKMITRDAVLQVPSPAVKSVSTLGAGDSMVAGMVWKLSQKAPLDEVLRFGVACGTAATLTEGSDLCRKEDVDRLYAGMGG